MKPTKLIALRNPVKKDFWFDVFPMALFENVLDALAWQKEQKIKDEDVEVVEVEVSVSRVLSKEEVSAFLLSQANDVLKISSH